VVKATPLSLYPRERDLVPIVVQEAAWAPGPIWTGADHLALTGTIIIIVVIIILINKGLQILCWLNVIKDGKVSRRHVGNS
jgi:hypothetical protein